MGKEDRNIKRCKGCRCLNCRWRAAGSMCYYNACGEDASLCSYCFNLSDASKELEQVKAGSYNCRGFQRAGTAPAGS